VPYASEITPAPTARTVAVVNNYTPKKTFACSRELRHRSVSGFQDGDKITVYRTSADTEPWAVLNVTSANLV
jgi:hypothetical protein